MSNIIQEEEEIFWFQMTPNERFMKLYNKHNTNKSNEPKYYKIVYYESDIYFGANLSNVFITAHSRCEAVLKTFEYLTINMTPKKGWNLGDMYEDFFQGDLGDFSEEENDESFMRLMNGWFENDTLWLEEIKK